MPTPIYKAELIKPSYHLRYTWTGWPIEGTHFPSQPNDSFFQILDNAWAKDNLKRISTCWDPDKIQLAFSTMPTVSPTTFVARVKGRLQHALRQAGTPIRFSRKVSFRSIGDNHTSEIEGYIARQVEKEQFADPRFVEMLKQFTVIDEKVVLNKPTKSSSGRYWYNLHLVLVGTDRSRLSKENDFATLDKALVATAKKHEYQLAARAWMPDHIHLSLRGNIDESPMDIALAFMNNTAYALGQIRIWQAGFYTGTFSEYDLRALRGRL